MATESMHSKIERLEYELNSANKTIQKLTNENLNLQEENLTLKLELMKNNDTDKTHNERGAGRKKTLNNDDVKEVNSLRADGMTVKAIAEKFNTSMSTIERILRKNKELEID